jgi:methionine-R-sulfoxide reductase
MEFPTFTGVEGYQVTMKHPILLAICAISVSFVSITVCAPPEGAEPGPKAGSPKRKDKVVKTEAEWKKKLTPAQYKILRASGTEIPFCSPFLDNKKKGTYHCIGCDLPLFRTDSKFDSGTGWPSFFQPVQSESIWTRDDRSYGMVRTEVLCARCDGHLGHVFDDGPAPSKKRFCINGEVLKFKETK